MSTTRLAKHYNYFRDYDPTIGRYVQSDPIGLGGGLNTFGYSLNQPMSRTDATGLNPVFVNPCGMCHNNVFAPPLGPTAPPILPAMPSSVPDIKGKVRDDPTVDTKTKNDDCPECEFYRDGERSYCFSEYAWMKERNPSLAADYLRGCLQRTEYRYQLCKRNGGKMPPDAPPPWSDKDIDGWPTIHD
jgi:RHS repeat-associated protein